jgi:hypothetical protein
MAAIESLDLIAKRAISDILYDFRVRSDNNEELILSGQKGRRYKVGPDNEAAHSWWPLNVATNKSPSKMRKPEVIVLSYELLLWVMHAPTKYFNAFLEHKDIAANIKYAGLKRYASGKIPMRWLLKYVCKCMYVIHGWMDR